MTEVAPRAAFAVPAAVGASTNSEATRVEQARAVAEVQAAVVVAQQCPRDMSRAEGEMRDACGRTVVAATAFYRVPNRGNGPSVHLARELARVWGNIDYGVRELRRDDVAKVSEIQAYAWDLQGNARVVRSFVVPHQRMKNKVREDLTDLSDVYLNNQNVGARAVRECIFSILPSWFVEQAQDLCRDTLRNGDGTPLPQRIEQMVSAFRTRFGVTPEQIEAKLSRKRGQWDAGDVATMLIMYRSLDMGEVQVGDEFDMASAAPQFAPVVTPPQPKPAAQDAPVAPPIADAAVTTEPAEREPEEAPAETGELLSAAQRGALFASFSEAGFSTDARTAEGKAARLAYLTNTCGREITSTNDLTRTEASRVIEALKADAREMGAQE